MGEEPADRCRWCGDEHGVLCPWVKALEFDLDLNGATVVKRVEFLTPADMVQQKPPAEPELDYPRLQPSRT